MIDNGLKKNDEIQTMKNYCFKKERNSSTCDHANESRGPVLSGISQTQDEYFLSPLI